jgi:3-hydroxyacyl-[acyl-carrier-protein] dehydratase
MRFLMVDRITELESGKCAKAVKNVTLSEDFFTHHFPQQPIMPGALIVECIVQLADWLIRENRNFDSAGLPAAFESIKFYRLVRPGDQLELKVEVLDTENQQYRLRGQAQCDQQVVAVARFTMNLVPATELQPVEDAKHFFQLIRRA